MTNNQDIEYQPPSPTRAGLWVILAVVFLLLMLMGLIAGWGTFLHAAPVLVQMLVYTVIFGFPLVVISLCAKTVFTEFHQMKRAHFATQVAAEELERARIETLKAEEELEALRDARQRENEAHQLMLAEAQLAPDISGNYPAVWDRRLRQVIRIEPGQFIQPVPNHYAPHFHYQDTSTKVSEEKQGQLGAGITQPSQDWLIGQLQENSLMVSPGVQAATGLLVKVTIVDVPHFKILGSTGFGKSCLAAALIDQATQLNSPDVFQLACLDLEHKTSRLFEGLPHIAQCRVGQRLVQMVATDADEVVEHLGYLKRLLDHRAGLSEAELNHQPIMFMYVEEMLSLQYEVVDPKQLKAMLADLTVLSVRGRKYGMFLLACMQTDYSSEEMRVSQKMFRFRAAAAVDVSAARAAGFQNTDLIKQNFQQGQPGQFVIEYPSFSQIVLAPVYDVKRLVTQKTSVSRDFNTVSEAEKSPALTLLKPSRNTVETSVKTDEATLQARFREVRQLQAVNWGKVAIVEKVWKVKAGGTIAYKNACAEYDQIVAQIEREA